MSAFEISVFSEILDYTVIATAQPYIDCCKSDQHSCQVWIFRHFRIAFNRLDLQNSIGIVYLLTSAQNMPMMLACHGISGIGAAGLLTLSVSFF
ncbi:hypothetical protein ACEPAG_3536 [Sanghuangporus baumii]